MRIVFMGTPQFAATILGRIAENHEVVGVFTHPDAIRSRGKKLEASPVKLTALACKLPVYEYASFKDNDAFEVLEGLHPDVICVAAYGVILPQAVIDLPPYGCLNVHGSLLPRWRGAAPIERAILAGDAEGGACIMQMEAGLDTGAYCEVRALAAEDLSAPELADRLAHLGADALDVVLDSLAEGGIAWTVQDETQVTYARKIEKGELDISPDLDRETALRRVRASSENHPCRAQIGGKDVTIVSALLPAKDAPGADTVLPGQVAFVAKRLYLGFSDGALELACVHPSGKKQMAARDFAAGLQGVKRGEVTWCSYGH